MFFYFFYFKCETRGTVHTFSLTATVIGGECVRGVRHAFHARVLGFAKKKKKNQRDIRITIIVFFFFFFRIRDKFCVYK